jgi:hypothetical protein
MMAVLKNFSEPGGPTLMAIIPDNNLAQAQEIFHEASQQLTVILTLAELINQTELVDNSVFEDIKIIVEQSLSLKSNFHNLKTLLIPGSPQALA